MARLEFGPTSLAVGRATATRCTGTPSLADVAAKDPLAELEPEIGVDRTAKPGEVSDAALGSQVIHWFSASVEASVNAQAAGAAVM